MVGTINIYIWCNMSSVRKGEEGEEGGGHHVDSLEKESKAKVGKRDVNNNLGVSPTFPPWNQQST